MKKLTFLLLLFVLTGVVKSQTKDIDPAQVPKEVKDNFTREYPAISVSWKSDGKNFKAYYTDPKTNMAHIIEYDRKGVVIRRENEADKLASPVNTVVPKEK